MRILVINAGSSSVKFSVFNLQTGLECFKSEIERVTSIADALNTIPEILAKANQNQIEAVGHRVAHGGEKFKDACVIDEAVIADIKACVPLAPMHNPPILAGIEMAQKNWQIAQVAVFDTAFHQAMPMHATTYAVPQKWRALGLRRYGFHGTSHRYIMERSSEALKIPVGKLRLISCHLGNGASICAINRGQSVDTSMGMTPLEGLVMGTRSGDVDPGVFSYVNRTLGLSVDQIENALYHDSGLTALSELGNDMRDIEQQAAKDNAKAKLALDVYAYRVKKYIGAYIAVMNGADAITFTGGIGENSVLMRSRICSGLDFLGLELDETYNSQAKLIGFEVLTLNKPQSKIKVLVTQTREQWMIAKETYRVLGHN